MKTLNGHLGARVHARRRELRLTQKVIAAAIGVTTQQIQKYEDGLATISAARLWQLAQALDVSPESFFDGYEPAGQADPRVQEAA